MGKEDVVYIYIYTIEWYSVIKRNGIVSFIEMWMDIETIIESEISPKEENQILYINRIC